jgi:TPR repeat protein
VAEIPKNTAPEVPRSPVEILMQRAQDGHDLAMNNLGMLYRDGRGVPQSDSEAVAWFRKAVEKGNAKAMTNLAIMYFKGRGVPRNEDEARRLMQRAAELGDDRARDMLPRESGMPDRQGGLPERRRPRPALP